MIDRLRDQIQERLDLLLGEADRLRRALTALGPGTPGVSSPKSAVPKPPSKTEVKAASPAAKRAPAQRKGSSATRPPQRTAPGATKAAVLAALGGGGAMTAGEVAAKAGLARATVSTTLSKLAKSGEIQKAERGYRLVSATSSSAGQ